MTAATYGTAIIFTGTASYVFGLTFEARRGVLEVAGNFGGGTVTPGYDDGAGNFAAFKDASGTAITTTSANAWEVVVPSSGKLAVTLTSATGSALVVAFKALK